MKTPSAPFIILGLLAFAIGKVVLGGFDTARQSAAVLAKKRGEVALLQAELRNLQADHDRRKASSEAQEAFLLTWTNEYKQVSSTFGTGIYALAEKYGVGVRDLKPGETAYKTRTRTVACERYAGQFVGSYSSIMTLIGEIERTYGLAAIQSISLGRRVMDVEMNFILVIPKIEPETAS